MHHDLKILPCYFHAVERGDKTFEIRDDRDRGFQAGDTVALHEFDPTIRSIEAHMFTGRCLLRKITYVTAFEQQPGFVVFSHKPEGGNNA